jgi:hypothetical protein
MEPSDMETAAKITARKRWEELLARYPEAPAPEHRRTSPRRDSGGDRVELTFERDGQAAVRGGRLLNASSEGVMIGQREELAPGTAVRLHVMLGEVAARLDGRVIHCTQTVGGFKVGIQLLFSAG